MLIMKAKLDFCFFMGYITLTASLNCEPKSQKIEVIDNGDYIFGFLEDETSNITQITYLSDTGISGEFTVVKSKSSDVTNNTISAERNRVTNFGNVGLCQLKVSQASDTGPKEWILTAHQTDRKFDPVHFEVKLFYQASILVETNAIVEGASFLQYITLPNKQWKRCTLKFNDVEIDLNLSSVDTFMFLSTFNEQKPNTNLVKEVCVGDWTIWSCGTDTSEQSYCALYNPDGKLVQDGRTCSYKSKTVLMSDIGKWKCITGIQKSMETEDYTLETINKGTEMVETWVKGDANFIKLGCKLKNPVSKKLRFCRVISPNNTVYNLLEGGATDRYVSLGTNLSESICAIEIPKPLKDFENGLWRCEMGGTELTGGFLKVGEVKYPDYPKYLRLSVQVKESFTILCEVPYTSEYCHIRSPSGTIYQTDNVHRTRLGHCSYTVKEASVTDNGKWFCSFAREMGTPDEEIVVEVTVAEVLIYYSIIEVHVGDKAKLMCSSGGLPLKYCRFVSPSGTAYHIHNHQTSKIISYEGKGLEYGECGISIKPVQISDNGIWTCITRIGADYKQSEITARISLVVSANYFEDPNIAAAVGLSVGIVIVSTIAGLIVFRKWRQRRNRQEISSQTRLINEGDNVILSLSDPTSTSHLSEDQRSHEHQP